MIEFSAKALREKLSEKFGERKINYSQSTLTLTLKRDLNLRFKYKTPI
jgi:hypothetical protein